MCSYGFFKFTTRIECSYAYTCVCKMLYTDIMLVIVVTWAQGICLICMPEVRGHAYQANYERPC